MARINLAVVMTDSFRCSRRTLQAIVKDLMYYSGHKSTLPVSVDAEVILKEIRRQLRAYDPEFVIGGKKDVRFQVGFMIERHKVLPEMKAHFERLKEISQFTQEEAKATIRMEEKWATFFESDDRFRRIMHWADRDAQQCERFYDLMIDALKEAGEKWAS